MRIAVDFDGTIVEHEYPLIGAPVPGAFEALREFKKLGATLMLWTMRSGKLLQEAVNFCKKNGVEFDFVNTDLKQELWTGSPKLYAQIYIDDAAFGCPLRDNSRIGARPLVDWRVVTPLVTMQLMREADQRAKLK